MPVDPTLLVVYTLALVSLTRLAVGLDTLTHDTHARFVTWVEGWPERAENRFDDTPRSAGRAATRVVRGASWFISELVSCPWCLSAWLAAGLVLPVMILWGDHPVAVYIALILAMRQVAGLLADR